MRNLAVLLIFPIILVFSACGPSYKTAGDSVTVKLKKTDSQPARLVRIQVISDDIFRVTSVPFEDFKDTESLSVVKRDSVFMDWTVTEKDRTLEISTATTVASMSLETGQVAFMDKSGSLLLKEANGGRSFTDIQVDGKSGLTMRQVFESPDDEAIYGLGQHQSEEINYKGKNEVLFQYNTKVSIPFIVSTKNYGILWDNYSLTRYGDPRDFSQLSVFKLFDTEGNEGGLTATYYENDDTTSVFLKQQEKEINYETIETVKNFPKDFPFYGSMITWEGEFEARETGTFRFGLYYAGYTKI